MLRLYFFIDNGANARKILKRLARSNRCFGEYLNVIVLLLSVFSSALFLFESSEKFYLRKKISFLIFWMMFSFISSRENQSSIDKILATMNSSKYYNHFLFQAFRVFPRAFLSKNSRDFVKFYLRILTPLYWKTLY